MQQEKQGGETLTYRTVGHAIDQSPITRPLIGVIVITALASLFDAGDAYMLAFVMPGIGKEFNARPETLGLLASCSLVGMTIGSIVWGWIADKAGRKIAFTFTLLMFSVFSGIGGFATSIGFLIGARFLAGLGIGGAVPVDASILAEFAPARIRGYSMANIDFPRLCNLALCSSEMGLAGTVLCIRGTGLAHLLDTSQRAGISQVAGQSRSLCRGQAGASLPSDFR
jgi:MFS family permease